MPSALIVAARAKVWPEASAVGHALTTLGGYDVHYLKAGLSVDRNLTGVATKKASSASTPKLLDTVKRTVLKSPVLGALALWRGIVADRIRLRAIFSALNPDVVVVFDDRTARPDLIICALAKARCVPVVVVPFAVSSVEADVMMRQDKSEHRVRSGSWRWLKRLVAWRWRDQVLAEGTSSPLLFFNVFDTVVLAATGILSLRPWVQGGGGADLVFASGLDEWAYLANGGIEPGRIAVTGQPSLDALKLDVPARERRRSELSVQYGLQGGLPMIVCAVPQDAEHHLVSWDRHREMTERLFEALAASGATVLLSMHPRSNRHDYEQAAMRHGLVIAEEPLAILLPAADMLVGTFSSTIRWAIGLGIPAIVIDALGLRLNLYRDLDGVTLLDDHAALAKHLEAFVNSRETRERLAVRAAAGAQRVGRVDGGAAVRFVDAMRRLLNGESSEARQGRVTDRPKQAYKAVV
jgi:hypothetical protein